MTCARRVRLVAPAKINPVLELRGRRDDGYHELATWMVALELADELVVESRAIEGGAPDVTLVLSGASLDEDVPRDASNLAVRAARAVLDEARRRGAAEGTTGLALALEKRVPSRAGLGGASSDAVAALLGAAAVLGFELDPAWRRAALSEFGSDCAFFCEAGATGVAVCTGRGERVEARPAIEGWTVALLTPFAGVSTAAAYGAARIRLSHSATGHNFPSESLGASAFEARRRLHNQLEQAACDVEPEVGRWRRLLDDEGSDHWRLCGSGSSFFGLYDDADEARVSLDRIRRAAGSRGLALRGSWITRPARHGVRFLSET